MQAQRAKDAIQTDEDEPVDGMILPPPMPDEARKLIGLLKARCVIHFNHSRLAFHGRGFHRHHFSPMRQRRPHMSPLFPVDLFLQLTPALAGNRLIVCQRGLSPADQPSGQPSLMDAG